MKSRPMRIRRQVIAVASAAAIALGAADTVAAKSWHVDGVGTVARDVLTSLCRGADGVPLVMEDDDGTWSVLCIYKSVSTRVVEAHR